MEVWNRWTTLRDQTETSVVEDMMENMRADDLSITVDDLEESLDYMEELDSNLELYEQDDWFHGTKTSNMDDIIEEGLIPGSENRAVTGEVTNSDSVSFSHFPVALNYALNGTPDLIQVQEHVDMLYDGSGPDTDTEAGREEVISVLDADNHHNVFSKLRPVLENYEALIEEYDSDPMIVGATRDEMENPKSLFRLGHSFFTAEQLENMTEMEVYERDDMSSSWIDLQAEALPRTEELRVYVPHEELEEYRDKHPEDVEVLSIEAMQMKIDHEQRETYLEKGVLDYDSVWSPGEYLFTLGVDEAEYNESAFIPCTSS